MPSWISDLILLAPWAAAILALAWLAWKVWPVARKISHFIDDVAGEPARPGFDARPGLMERLATVEGKQDDQTARLQSVEQKQDDLNGRVAVVQHEVTTNHGSSLKDSVKRLEARVDKIAPPIVELHDKYVKE